VQVPEEEVLTEDQGFVTVPELARALSISERQAARWALRVSDIDRHMSDTRQTRVRLASVIELRSKATGKPSASQIPTDTTSDVSDINHQMSDTDREMTDTRQTRVRRVSDVTTPTAAAILSELELEKRRSAVLEAEKEGLIARLADASLYLSETVSDRDAWREQAGRLDTRLAEALGALQQAQDEARAARLIGQRSVMQLEASGFTDATVNEKSSSDAESQQDSGKCHPFWAFWKTKKRQ
jgi:hypothetical protein